MSSAARRILLVEDEHDLARGVCDNLAAEGYEVEHAADGDRGLEVALGGGFDLLILDVMLPGLDGFSICREVRKRDSRVPVLFLSARGDPQDRIQGLQEGGDDYLPKPFDLRELLLLRVGAILRRGEWYASDGPVGSVLEFGGNEVDLRSYHARAHDGTDHELTHKEAMVLKYLAEHAGDVVSRDDILDTVWGYDSYPSTRTIDNFIVRLRKRFEPDPRAARHLHTVHGVGYRFTFDAA